MLTLEQIRQVDPSLKSLSDEELTRIRDDLHQLVQIVFSIMQQQKCSKSPGRALPKAEQSLK